MIDDDTLYEVIGGSAGEIRHDAKGLELILQSVRVALTTRVGTVPLHRDWGTRMDFLDSPMGDAMAQIQTDVFDVLEELVPAVELDEIKFEGDAMEGRLVPVAVVRIRGEDEFE